MLLLSITSLTLVLIQFSIVSSFLAMMYTSKAKVCVCCIMTGFDDTEALAEGIVLQAIVGLVRVENFASLRWQEMVRGYRFNGPSN
jgi:hypothetical protein